MEPMVNSPIHHDRAAERDDHLAPECPARVTGWGSGRGGDSGGLGSGGNCDLSTVGIGPVASGVCGFAAGSGGFVRRGGTRACYNCGDEGHKSRDCKNPKNRNAPGPPARRLLPAGDYGAGPGGWVVGLPFGAGNRMVVPGADVRVNHLIMETLAVEKRERLMELLNAGQQTGMGADRPQKMIVFIRDEWTADSVAKRLPSAAVLSAQWQSPESQMARMAAFHDGDFFVLIATTNHGPDTAGVDDVINYDLPPAIDEYVHRIGRRGRIGNPVCATSFYDRNRDGALAGDLVKVLVAADQSPSDFLLRDMIGGEMNDVGGAHSYIDAAIMH